MARIDLPEGTEDESLRLLSLQPSMGNAMAVLTEAIYSKSDLDIRVREAVRMRIAQLNQCHICLQFRFPELEKNGINEAFYKALDNWRDNPTFSEKEKWAIEYTERFILDHLSIDELFMNKLKDHFSAKETFELTYTIAGLLANGRTLQVLQVDQVCSL